MNDADIGIPREGSAIIFCRIDRFLISCSIGAKEYIEEVITVDRGC
ncbi:hypothetical protein [Methanomassiliicoccus luminyensis]|nr:hypothetical protein [Methanomassiliicoccus luminyensis]